MIKKQTVLPWVGSGNGPSRDAIRNAARRLGIAELWLRAVMEVEAAGEWFNPDGTLPRRFEPHLMPGVSFGWRKYLRAKRAVREQMFRRAFAELPEAALKATSWGAFQILGRWHELLGYTSAADMVQAFADNADAQLNGFVAYVVETGGDAALRAGDVEAFVASYNGPGNVAEYSKKIRKALDAMGVTGSPVVLSLGDRGPAVRDAQRRLGVKVDGKFGARTEAAVVEFQRRQGLAPDGVLGQRTWGSLANGDLAPEFPQGAARPGGTVTFDGFAGWLGSVSASIGGLLAVVPASALEFSAYLLVGGVCVLALIYAYRLIAR